MVPINAIRYTPQGTEVVIFQQGTLKIQSVKLGRNLGRTIEILSGLDGSEELLTNPADDLKTGDHAVKG